MIKVITLEGSAWDIGVYATEQENVNESSRKYAYESSILNKFLETGWSIKDWNMTSTKGPARTWTFILEKNESI